MPVKQIHVAATSCRTTDYPRKRTLDSKGRSNIKVENKRGKISRFTFAVYFAKEIIVTLII